MIDLLTNNLTALLPTKLVTRIAHRRRKFVGFNERSIEFGFVFNQLAAILPETILDVGTGKTALPSLMANTGSLVTAVDNVKDFWPTGMINRHFYVQHDDITNTKISEHFDLVTCVSVLEHIEKYDLAVENMVSLLNDGGHLIITSPHSNFKYCQNVYDESDSSAYNRDFPFVCQSFSNPIIDSWLEKYDLEIVSEQYWKLWTGKFWTTGERIMPAVLTDRDSDHQLMCILFRKR